MPGDTKGQLFPDDRFITAFTESQSALRGFCAASIGNSEDSRDVFQKVCLVLWKKVGDWDPETPFLRWAFAVARYEILAYVRDHGRDQLVFDEDVVLAMASTSERLADSQSARMDSLEFCLAKLKPDHHEALSAHYVKGYNFQEICRSGFNCDPSTLRFAVETAPTKPTVTLTQDKPEICESFQN